MNNFTGVLTDPRSQSEKDKDFQHEEFFGMGEYVWNNFNEGDVPQLTIRNQNGSGMCGPFSTTKALGVNNKREVGVFVNLLPPFIYYFRANKPGAGMYMQNMFDIACTYGAPMDAELKGDNLTEDQANAYVPTKEQIEEAKKYRGKNYMFISPKNIDGIAQALDAGYTPIILLRCDISEWTTEPTVNHNLKAPFNINHFVPLVYKGMRNGKKTFVADDSWGSSYGANGHRYITEDFILNRVEAIGYVIDLPTEPKPSHTFTKWLKYGMMNDADVTALQLILKHEGCLDASVPPTGNYLNLTAQGVMKLQLKNQIASPKEVADLRGRQVGPKTIAYLNKKYA